MGWEIWLTEEQKKKTVAIEREGEKTRYRIEVEEMINSKMEEEYLCGPLKRLPKAHTSALLLSCSRTHLRHVSKAVKHLTERKAFKVGW